MLSVSKIVLISLGTITSLVGQQRPSRGLVPLEVCRHGTYAASEVGETFNWQFHVSDTGEITTMGPDVTTPNAAVLAALGGQPEFAGLTANTVTAVTRTAQSLVTVPGGHCAVGPDLNLLVAGRTASGDGRVEHWEVDAVSGDLVLKSSQQHAGRDWSGVAYDPLSSRIYLLDAITGDIFRGSWSLAANGLPNSLLLHASSASYVGGMALSDLCLRFVQSGSSEVPVGGALFVYEWLEQFESGSFLQDVGGSIVVTTGTFWSAYGGWGPTIRADTASEGDTTIDIAGTAGKVAVLNDLRDGLAVGSGLIPSSGVVTLTLSSPLIIGRVYEAQYAGESTEFVSSFECVARYGIPETTTFGLTFNRRIGELDATIGNDHFTIMSHFQMDPAPSTPGPVLGAWMLGNFRDQFGVDPIIIDPLDGQGEVVLPISTLPADGFIYANGSGRMRMNVPITNDPALIGAVLLSQFSILDPTSPSFLKFSEVIGFTLRDQS